MRRFIAALVMLAAITGCSDFHPFAPVHPASVVSPAPTLLAMPNVVGENAEAAKDKLTKLGFTNITFGTMDGRIAVILPQNWTVKTQSALPDQLVTTDMEIVLGCVRNG